MGLAEFLKGFFGKKELPAWQARAKPDVTEATHHVPTVAETVVAGAEEAVVPYFENGAEEGKEVD